MAGEGALGEFDVAGAVALDAHGAAKVGRLRQLQREILVEHRLDLGFRLVRQLEAVRPEQLDAIVFKGIVRGRNHHPDIGPHGRGQHGDGGRRDRPEQQRVHADRGEAGHHGVFDHVA